LHQSYAIHGAGAPFERLFFEAGKELEEVILRLGNARKKPEFYAQMDPRYDDLNFIEAHSHS
jgi:hypothetical protein